MQSTTIIFYGEVLERRLKRFLTDKDLNGVRFCPKGINVKFRTIRAEWVPAKHGFVIKKLKVPAQEIAALFKSGIA